MSMGWQVQELVDLVRERYPNWRDMAHVKMMAEEVAPKRKAAAKAKQLLNKGEFNRLLRASDYDEIVTRMQKIGRDTNLLWTAQPKRGDCAILYAENLNKWEFCEQMRALIYDKRPSPDKIDTFSEYCQTNHLPNKWPFVTYFLFILRPHAEMFVKPRIGKWFLQFMGNGEAYTSKPSADMYERYKKLCHGLKGDLTTQGVKDMIDIQSLIWVAARESQNRVAGMNTRALVELDRPPKLREQGATYQVATKAENNPLFSQQECADLLARDETEIGRWIQAIERKGQAVLTGPPGTGKTFTAEQLARVLLSGGDGLSETIQFHPAYDYADFIEGIRPQTDDHGHLTYQNTAGLFVRFCQKAAERQAICVLIIDEINRANLSQVFGELFYLLEYRNRDVQLASGTRFKIPENVRLIGTMNTADRSIALVDHALRRRFAFISLPPHYELLRVYHRRETGLNVEPLCQLLEKINRDIDDDHYELGVSYFLTPRLATDLADIWHMEIIPYLEEFFFNRHGRVGPYRWERVKHQLNLDEAS